MLPRQHFYFMLLPPHLSLDLQFFQSNVIFAFIEICFHLSFVLQDTGFTLRYSVCLYYIWKWRMDSRYRWMKPVPSISQYKLQPLKSRQTGDSDGRTREASGCLYPQAIILIYWQSIGVPSGQIYSQMYAVILHEYVFRKCQ